MPPWLPLVLSLVASGSARGDSATGTGDAPDEARSHAALYVREFERLHRLQAENALLDEELRRTERGQAAGGVELLRELAGVAPEPRALLTEILTENSRPYFEALPEVRAEAERDLDVLREQWTEARVARQQAGRAAFEARAQEQVAGRLAALLNVDNRWLWLAGVLAVGTLLGVYLVDRRHHLRRLFWVRKTRYLLLCGLAAVLVAVPLLPTVLTFGFGNRTYESLLAIGAGDAALPQSGASEADRLTAEIDERDLPRRNEMLRRQVEEQQNAGAGSPDAAGEARDLVRQAEAARVELRQAIVSLTVQARMAEGLGRDLAELEAVRADLAARRTGIVSAERTKRLVAGGLGTSLLLLTGGLGFVFVRGRRRRERRVAETCPQCLAVGKLVPYTDNGAAGRLGLEELRCTNIIREDPYEECEFTFHAAYRGRVKAGFPTLGVASSGKSHWMSMVYRELNRGRYPEKVHFEKVKSRGSEQFDMMVDQILGARMSVAATITGRIPEPLIFSFRDNDRLHRSTVLVSLFDYAGQVTSDENNFHRRRALDGDGFLFFLDPTKPSEMQADALVNFREDLKLVKGLKPGQQINEPVALCVSKLDLMVNQEYAGENGELVYDFYRELAELDAQAAEMSLESIRRRSALVAELRDTIWPGWNIERQIHDLFGGRYMFFPMTPVGMNEPGVTDLARRTIAPYAILEPLLWLLHMNGFPVLD